MSFSRNSFLKILTIASAVSISSTSQASRFETSLGDFKRSEIASANFLKSDDKELFLLHTKLKNIVDGISIASNDRNNVAKEVVKLKSNSSKKIQELNMEIQKYSKKIAALLQEKSKVEQMVKLHKPPLLKQYPGMSQTIALWGTQKKAESLKNISIDIEIPKFSKGTESNLMVMLQGTIAGDIFNVGYYYDGKNLDSSGKPSRAFVIRRWINAPDPAGASSIYASICSANEENELFRGKIKKSSDKNINQKMCYSKESFMSKLVPVNDYVNTNAPSIEIFSELNWEPGKYKISISNIGKDVDGDWYSFDVKDSNQISYNMGMLKFSNSSNQMIGSVSGSYSIVLSQSAPVQMTKKGDNEFKYLVGNLIGSASSTPLDGQAMKAVQSNGNKIYVRTGSIRGNSGNKVLSGQALQDLIIQKQQLIVQKQQLIVAQQILISQAQSKNLPLDSYLSEIQRLVAQINDISMNMTSSPLDENASAQMFDVITLLPRAVR